MFNKMVEIVDNEKFSSDDLKIAGYNLFKKLAAGTAYNPTKKFNGPIMLIKAADNFIQLEDYGLSEVRFLPERVFLNSCTRCLQFSLINTSNECLTNC